MATEDPLSVDELVTGKAAERLGDGYIAVSAILLVETISENGRGLRFVMNDGLMTWHAIGMLRSVQQRIESEDLSEWEGEVDDL